MISDAVIWELINNKTKPIGALGDLELLAFQICRRQNSLTPKITNPNLLVFAADHGLTDSGVSAYPKAVTAQMVMNFVAGGAAINVFCRQHGIALNVVDAGVDYDFPAGLDIHHSKVAKGTQSCLTADAISTKQLDACFEYANQHIEQLRKTGCNLIGFGEMGIGNTSSATLIAHYLTGKALNEITGKGTGLDNKGLNNKLEILKQVVSYHGHIDSPEAILRAVGGLEIAMMTQAMIAASEADMLVMVDGFIASAAALLATRLSPTCRESMIFCHQSEEPGHKYILEHLNAKPLLTLNMRLGEGSGCALAYPLIISAVEFVNKMASFESAQVATKESTKPVTDQI